MMMPALTYVRPNSIEGVLDWLANQPESNLLAGGQSLLAAAKLGLAEPSHLIDLRWLPELREIREQPDHVWIGATATHDQIAKHPIIINCAPMLSKLAAGIADQQVRNRGTIGGSVALHDPSACWPTGVLAANACVVTNKREIPADEFFDGLFATALERDELILGLKFPRFWRGVYLKSEQKASRFALVGVAVVKHADSVRIAITGLGHGVVRWHAAESVLHQSFDAHKLLDLVLDTPATDDIHASATYRLHLAKVLTVRAVAQLCKQPAPLVPFLAVTAYAQNVAMSEAVETIEGAEQLSLEIDQVWRAIQDPDVLRRAMPGCQTIDVRTSDQWQATVRVGLGFVAAKFETQIQWLERVNPGSNGQRHLAFRVAGDAGLLGSAEGQAQVNLSGNPSGTRVVWQVTPQVHGRLAQLGNRLMHATAKKIANEFFANLACVLDGHQPAPIKPNSISFIGRIINQIRRWIGR